MPDHSKSNVKKNEKIGGFEDWLIMNKNKLKNNFYFNLRIFIHS